ncbi:Transcription factor Sox-10 [Psilocybe cubensis]|uniref:HMG box domain-containing protein n=2 Tax=Psilocybe cubensis TaxID=181762 RepID=A0A8H7XYW1_PSICU|nr:Transcription factor Sox-10 [Psilocybe cubensis]KAH9478339.1 Transcription factor Sox-10 [Psilocybe cubensis]
MPAFRNVAPNRHSGRLGKHIPVIYDKDGWQVPDHEVKVESLDDACPRALKQEDPLPQPLLDPLPDVDATAALLPARRNSHTRRREPGHIPRPRNAFIFFRSAYISRNAANGEGQQNELSKHAAKVWNKMSDEDRRPYCELAAIEKQEHYLKHPDYVYSPGRSSGKGKPKAANPRKTSGVSNAASKKRKASNAFEDRWSKSPDTSSSSPSPTSPIARPAKMQRAAARRAVERFLESPSPAPSAHLSPASEDEEEEFQYPPDPNPHDNASSPETAPPISYVPTSEIPDLQFTPVMIQKQEEKQLEVTYEPPPFHPHLDPVTGEYAYQSYKHDFMATSMPILPNASSSSFGDYSFDAPADPKFIPIPTATLQSFSYFAESSSTTSGDVSSPHDPILEADSILKQYTDAMDIDSGSNEYFEMDQDPDASIFQFFNFE